MAMHLLNAIEIIDDILSKVDEFAKEAPAPAQAGVSASPADGAASKKGTKKIGKKAKKEASATPAAATENVQSSDPFAIADLRAARVLEAEPVEGSDKLWLCKVDCGDENPRQVVAGLQAFVPQDVMRGLSVVTVCNLKPAKLAGQVSDAMILAAGCMDGETRIVKTLKPPDGFSPGERVHAGEVGQPAGEVGQPAGEPAKLMKSKTWLSVVEQMKTSGGVPVYAGKQLCTKSGCCGVNGSIADGSSIS